MDVSSVQQRTVHFHSHPRDRTLHMGRLVVFKEHCLLDSVAVAIHLSWPWLARPFEFLRICLPRGMVKETNVVSSIV
jgi:hypothetical protein